MITAESAAMQKRMPGWLITTSLGIGAMVGLCAAAAAAGAIEMASGDACRLLTAAQVSTALGVQVDDGAYSIPGNKQFCVWREHGKPQMTAQNVQLNLLTARQYEAPKATSFAKGSESGLGDEAYWSNTPGFGFALSVKKGSRYFRVQSRPIPEGVARKSDSPADKAKWEEKEKTVERAVAPLVLKSL
jgi:hypothetical protein